MLAHDSDSEGPYGAVGGEKGGWSMKVTRRRRMVKKRVFI